jgi:hypothetical protein
MATERPVLTGNQGGGGLGSRLTTRGLPARARLALRLAGGGLLIATGAIHLDLYLTGYRSIPAIGWLFLLQVIAAFGLAAVVLASGEWLGRGRFLPGRSPWPGNRAVPGQSRCSLDDCSRDRGKTAPSPGTNQMTPVPGVIGMVRPVRRRYRKTRCMAHGSNWRRGRQNFVSQVEKTCSRIPQKSFAPTKLTRKQSSRYCPPASRTTLSADGYSQMTTPGNGCIRIFSAPLFKWR